jgi:hypothetical protein
MATKIKPEPTWRNLPSTIQQRYPVYDVLDEYAIARSDATYGYPYRDVVRMADIMPGSAGSATIPTLLLIGGLVAVVVIVAALGGSYVNNNR